MTMRSRQNGDVMFLKLYLSNSCSMPAYNVLMNNANAIIEDCYTEEVFNDSEIDGR